MRNVSSMSAVKEACAIATGAQQMEKENRDHGRITLTLKVGVA